MKARNGLPGTAEEYFGIEETNMNEDIRLKVSGRCFGIRDRWL
jgi:hypothetical protein